MSLEDKPGTTDQQHQDAYKTWRFRLEVAALIIVALGTGAAWLTLVAIRDSVNAMNDQIKADRQALWLDHRPWLGVSSAEVIGGFELGGKPTIRLNLVNGGKTPARNVKLRERVSLTFAVRENENRKWEAPDELFDSIPYRSYDAFPISAHHHDITWPFPFNEKDFAMYTNSEIDVTVWSRIEYCSLDLSFHWTLIGLSKTFAEDEPLIRHISSSAHPGVPGHPNCSDPASGEQ